MCQDNATVEIGWSRKEASPWWSQYLLWILLLDVEDVLQVHGLNPN